MRRRLLLVPYSKKIARLSPGGEPMDFYGDWPWGKLDTDRSVAARPSWPIGFIGRRQINKKSYEAIFKSYDDRREDTSSQNCPQSL